MWFRTFLRKYKIHLIILFISILIWIHVKTDKVYEETFQARIVPINVNPEYVIANRYTKSVPVKFQSKGKDLIALRNTDIEIVIDLHGTTKTKIEERLNLNSVRISPPIVNLLPLEFVGKDTIHIIQDALNYAQVPVKHRITIKPKAGYIQVGKLEITPSKITVSGPRTKVTKIEILETDSLIFDDSDSDVNGIVNLVNPFPEDIDLSSAQVEYSADIQEIGTQFFEDIPIKITNRPRNLEVSAIPSTISLTITGGVEVVSNLQREAILAYIDFQRYDRKKNNSLPATIKIPEEITISDVYPELFEIKIENK